jgi:general L-amino acid transport system permease protein
MMNPGTERRRLRPLAALFPAGWLRLPFILNALVTLAVLLAIFLLLRAVFSFLIVQAAAPDDDVAACRTAAGVCWPFIASKLHQFLFGRYPEPETWRAIAAMIVPPASLVLAFALQKHAGFLGFVAAIGASLPAAFFLLAGGLPGLWSVSTELWGGLTLTLMVSYTGFAASLPLGIALALARRSSWPVPRWLAIIAIEFWRGVPLVTVLFMASVMLPLFLPEGVSVNKLARALVAIALFASAYMAEVIRGGLQSVAQSQYESAEALGFSYVQMLRLVILPQALRNALPGITGTFIGLLKDTTLVLIIGLFDFLGMIQLGAADPAWASPSTVVTGYAFAALVFWCLCFGISRLGAALENIGFRKRA